MSQFSSLYIASDHGGFSYKQAIFEHLRSQGHVIHDLGPFDTASVDYPDFASLLAAELKEAPTAGGILVCGSGIGISIAANRYPWIRAALVHDVTGAHLCREHNQANVLALGERLTGLSTALDCVDTFITTAFEGGRHEKRVAKLSNPAG